MNWPHLAACRAYFRTRENRRFLVLAGSLLFVMAGLRFWDLEARPMHSDESVNAWFLQKLVTEGQYRYDPQNYHGPSLYYLQLLPTWMNSLLSHGPLRFHFSDPSGITKQSVRSGVALAGVLLLVGLLCAVPLIGRTGALVALLGAGLSPSLLFYSRYFIHEIFFVLFTLGLYLSAAHYRRYRRPLFLVAAAAFGALIFATKETSLIVFFVLTLAGLCAEMCHQLLCGQKPSPGRAVRDLAGAFRASLRTTLVAVGVGVSIWATLYSAFFTNWAGLMDSFLTFSAWMREGLSSGHAKPFGYFLNELLLPYEMPLVVLSLLGVVSAFWLNDRRGLFLAAWSVGMLLAHSLIPYKTPWLVITIVLPMALLSGYGVQTVHTAVASSFVGRKRMRALVGIWLAFVLLMGTPLPTTVRLVFHEFDDGRHPHVYVQTRRSMYDMLETIARTAALSGQGHDIKIHVVGSMLWPLPFYLREYPNTMHWGRFKGLGPVDAPIVIATRDQEAELAEYLKEDYLLGFHALRPGVDMLLYVNKRFDGIWGDPLPAVFKPVPVPETLLPGLIKDVFSGTAFRPPPLTATRDLGPLDFRWDSGREKPHRAPFSIRWTGLLEVAHPGRYRFILASDDGSWLWINRHLVIDNGGEHAVRRRERAVHLAAGYHAVEIRYVDVGGGAALSFLWDPPRGRERVVPPSVLFHSHDMIPSQIDGVRKTP